jgi:EmrB/QacA subfamily drug resistance transporter
MSEYTKFPWAAVLATNLAIFTANINLTGINLALPAIMQDFNTPITTVQWIMTAYIIVSGMFMILGGRLGDLYGRRNIFLISLILWLSSLLLSGFATNIGILILSRALSGLAFALGLPTSMILLTSAFPEHKLPLAIGINITITGLAQAIGPTLSGCFLQYFNWHWIFFANIPLIGIALINTLFFIPKDHCINKAKDRLDYSGTILLVLSLGSLMFALHCISENQLSLLIRIGSCLIIPVMFVIFYFFERKATHPIVDFALLKFYPFLLINVLRALFQFIYFSLLFVLPIYLLNTLHITPIMAGTMMLYMTVTFFVAALFIGKLSIYIGEVFLVTFSFILFLVVFILLTFCNTQTTNAQLIIPFILIGVAAACMYGCSTSIAIRLAPLEKKGAASGIFFTFALLGSACGVTISSLIMQMYTEQPNAIGHHTTLFDSAFSCTMWMCVSVTTLGLILTLFQRKTPMIVAETNIIRHRNLPLTE